MYSVYISTYRLYKIVCLLKRVRKVFKIYVLKMEITIGGFFCKGVYLGRYLSFVYLCLSPQKFHSVCQLLFSWFTLLF